MLIWDRLVRLWHWSLVLTVVLNYWVLEGGSDPHNILGYVLFGLLLARLGWGIWGSNPLALFKNFVPTPSAIKEHLAEIKSKTVPTTSGHNPIGALMIYFTLIAIGYLTVTGFLHEEVDHFFGNDFLQDSHKWVSDALIIAAGIHVSGVLIMQKLTGIPLIKTMLTGKREIPNQ